MSLKQKAFSAVRWTTASTVARVLLQIGQTAVLARLLAPEDYGLMAVVLACASFATLLGDLGVNSAYIQRQLVTEDERSSLFWLNLMMGAGLALLLIVLSPILASFFGEERIASLMMLIATTFVVAALGQQVRASAEKALLFRPLMLVEISAAALGFGAAVGAAVLGWSVYSLVFGSIVTSFTSTALAWIFVAQGWRPQLRFKMRDVRPYVAFGGSMVGASIVNQLTMSIDLLIGGRLLLASQLGLYSVPRSLVLQMQFMINPIVTRVGFPLIAKVQHDVPRVKEIYLKTVNLTASTNAPLYVGLAFFAPDVVNLLLGSGWDEAAEFLRVLALWGFVRSTANPVGSLLYGMGKAQRALAWNLVLLLMLPPLLWWGSRYGARGLAWALLASAILLFSPGWYYLVRPLCRASFLEYSLAALKPLILALVSVAPAIYIVGDVDSSMLRLAVGLLVAAPLYVSLCLLWNRVWIDSMRELVSPRHVVRGR